uniref:Uncharacterized protein n=1 Tax=Helianthus annuus TaxID=4232 RepID=A0A251T8P8_HELAN
MTAGVLPPSVHLSASNKPHVPTPLTFSLSSHLSPFQLVPVSELSRNTKASRPSLLLRFISLFLNLQSFENPVELLLLISDSFCKRRRVPVPVPSVSPLSDEDRRGDSMKTLSTGTSIGKRRFPSS